MTRPMRSRTSVSLLPSASISARIWSAEPGEGVENESVRLTDQLLCGKGRRKAMIGKSTSTAENAPAAKDSTMIGDGIGATRKNQGARKPTRIPRDCGDLEIRIARDGTWSYRGSPIGRAPLVRLFASVLRREADGSYWLVTPAERGRVAVDDVPFTAVELTVEGEGREQALIFRTNVDDSVTADENHPLRVAI